MAATALVIRLKLGSPVIFRQQRAGLRGEPFTLVKFRTMTNIAGAEAASDASRLTTVGRLLRSFSIDELPTLWNVLRGEMSLVGPRPLLLDYLPRYTPSELRRHDVRPGVTGWAQVNGRNGRTWRDKLELDVWYVEHQSFVLDLRIMAGTIGKVLRRDGISADGEATMPEFSGSGDGSDKACTENYKGQVQSVFRVHLSPPDVGELEKTYVLEALESGWVAPLGPHVDAFESAIASYVGVEHAVALSSGTGGLHLALIAAGVGKGDEVVVPCMTFAATAFAVAYVGAKPIFIDSEPQSWNLDPALLSDLFVERARSGRLPKAVISVDIFGRTADYDRIVPICAEYNVPLIEDAAEALGATHVSRMAGAFGAAGVFSFNGNKIMTTSGGGVLVTDDAELAQRVRHLATQAREPVPWYEHQEIGYNYRMSNILAALGSAQLLRLPDMITQRRSHQDLYRKLLKPCGVNLIDDSPWGKGNGWLTIAVFDDPAAPSAVRELLLQNRIEARPVWKPMHKQPIFMDCESRLNGNSDELFNRGLCLPSGSRLDPKDVALVSGLVAECVEGRNRLSRNLVTNKALMAVNLDTHRECN